MNMQKILPERIQDIFSLTPLQEGILFHYLNDTNNQSYFEQLSLKISGELQLKLFEKAWNIVIETNEMLRVVYRWENVEKPVQIILKEHPLQLQYIDISDKNETEKRKQLEKIKIKDRENGFDLRQVPFRITLCKRTPHQHEMIISNHHIIYDGWSNGIILKEFYQNYYELLAGERPVKAVKIKFKEFIKIIQTRRNENGSEYWRSYLRGYDRQYRFALIEKGKNQISMDGKNDTVNFHFSIPEEKKNQLEMTLKAQKITFAAFFYSVWGLLLQHYNNCDDIIFGTTVSGRSANIRGIESIVGLFINTLPLRVKTPPTSKVLDLLKSVNQSLSEREEFERTPLVEISACSELEKGEELFDTLLVIENYPLERRLMDSKGDQAIRFDSFSIRESSNYDFMLSMLISNEIEINFIYKLILFSKGAIERLARHFSILINILTDKNGFKKRLSDIDMLSAIEKREILNCFNNTELDYPAEKTIPQLFSEQVQKTPDLVALFAESICNMIAIDADKNTLFKNGSHLSFGELDRISHQLSSQLVSMGIQCDTLVGVMMNRSLELIIGLLGILKSGGAYLPLDPGYPQGRIIYILEKSNPGFLLTETDLSVKNKIINNFEKKLKIINIADLINPLMAEDIHKKFSPLAWLPKSDNLAYVIFTSGSTGNPKGVMVQHNNVVNFIEGMAAKIKFSQGKRLLGLATISFDIFVLESWLSLVRGLQMVLVSEEQQLDAQLLSKVIIQQGIQILQMTPSRLKALLNTEGVAPPTQKGAAKKFCPLTTLKSSQKNKKFEDCSTDNHLTCLKGIQELIVGGEELPALLFKQVKAEYPGGLYNVYGPTETTVWSTIKNLSQSEFITIGAPIANTQVYILDRYYRLQPAGIPGELFIGGEGVARGYLNNPELTSDVFCLGTSKKIIYKQNFLRGPGAVFLKSAPGCLRQKFYKTGDLARWLYDGELEFLGRRDFQVKVHGFRIQLEEIQEQILTFSGIREALVISGTDKIGDTYLCAYLVWKENPSTVNHSFVLELKTHLSGQLPYYMIPTYFMELKEVPLTPNGKLDRKQLPNPVLKSRMKYIAPRDSLERQLGEIWAGLFSKRGFELPLQGVGIDDNFFQLGGHSLLAISLISLIYRELKVKIPLQALFKAPTIRGQAKYIRDCKKEKYMGIPSIEKQDYYPLSSAQKRLYIIQQMDLKNTVYNMPVLFPLPEGIKIHQLQSILESIIQRHESFRTSFQIYRDVPIQRIHDKVFFKIEQELNGEIKVKDLTRPFDLSQAPLVRVKITNDAKYQKQPIIFFDIHHIISDGVSQLLLEQEFLELCNGKGLPKLRLQYKDFVHWRNGESQQQLQLLQGKYWRSVFHKQPTVLNLPIDFPRPLKQNFNGSFIDFDLSDEEQNLLLQMVQETGSTLFMAILSIYTLLLSKLSEQESIVVGTPISGRRHPELESIIGIFINTLALQNFPVGDKYFSQYLEEVKEQTLQAFENQEYPFEDLVNMLKIQPDVSRNPIFDTFFNLNNAEMSLQRLDGIKFKSDDEINIEAKFDLTLRATESEDGLSFGFVYMKSLFKEQTIRRFIHYFKKIIATIIKNRDIKLSGIGIINESEKLEILEKFNNTTVEYPEEKKIDQLFSEQVNRTPDALALVGARYSDRIQTQTPGMSKASITYRELNNRSNLLAMALQVKTAEKGSLIAAILIERSLEMIIGILGTLKASYAYLPIALDYPGKRLQYILTDSQCQILLTTKEFSRGKETTLKTGRYKIVFMDTLEPFHNPNFMSPNFKEGAAPATQYGLTKENGGLTTLKSSQKDKKFEDCIIESNSENLAYVIYTSGTTGKPKGVMVNHRNVVNVISWFARSYGIETGTRVPLLTEYTFDASVNQIFATLTHGGCLHIIPQSLVLDIGLLRQYIKTHRINLVNFVPMVIKELLAGEPKLESIDTVISGADELTSQTKDKLIEKGYQLYNHYGPTEGTIDALAWKCVTGEPVILGYPMDNVCVYILDKYNHLLPVGVSGELVIGGVGIARGYLNQPELTSERFCSFIAGGSFCKSRPLHTRKNFLIKQKFLEVQKPFYKKVSGPRRDKCYKTGDLGRWLFSGGVEFLGRLDFQVKIRGFRIELAEIESLLLTHPQVIDAVVIARERETHNKALYGYVVLNSDQKLETVQPSLGEFLSHRLPVYMVPTSFIVLGKIPLTVGGKIDRSALPDPQDEKIIDYQPPINQIEEKLVEIWSDILGIERENIGRNANFLKLGGHSLKATILMARIQRKFNVSLQLEVLFKTLYLHELATIIKNSKISNFSTIDPVEKKDFYPLSPMQKRLYILHEMDKQGVAYNIPSIWEINGFENRTKLKSIFYRLFQRHESLRTSFHIIDNEIVQRIQAYNKLKFDVQYIEIDESRGEWKKGDIGGIQDSFKKFICPFDLTHPLLLRVRLLKIQGKKYFLMVDMHHIITDGFSIGILINDFIALYQEAKLSIPRIQYKDFSEWFNHPRQQEKIEQQGQFWINQFPEEISLLNLPIDFPRPVVQDFNGNCLHFNIKQEHAQSLKTLAQNSNVTDFMLLLSIYHIFLTKLSGQKDIVVGIPISGRQHSGVQDTIGMFVNTLALRNYSYEDQTFTHFLQEIKALTLNAFENQDSPFENLIEKLPIERDTSRNPLFDVLFNFQNLVTPKLENHNLSLIPCKYETGISKFDLTLTIIDESDSFSCLFEYCTTLFKETTIKRFISYFQQILFSVVSNPGISISEIEIITEKEKQKILKEFNTPIKINLEYATLHHLFEEQEKFDPNGIALEMGTVLLASKSKNELWVNKIKPEGKKSGTENNYSEGSINGQISYSELNNKANQLAQWLIKKGVTPGSIIGIMLDRSIEMLIAIFGVLKAGGGYLPLDFNSPKSRIQYIVKDSAIKYILTRRSIVTHNLGEITERIALDDNIYSGSTLNPKRVNNLSGIAYVIYTSGSTGSPKGVIIDHHSVLNVLIALYKIYPFSKKDVYLLKTSFLFDVSVTEIFGWILGRGKLVLLKNDGEKDPGTILNTIESQHVTHINFVPSMFNYFVNYLNNKNKNKLFPLKYIFLAGEEVIPSSIEKFKGFNTHISLENLYGPTEGTIYASRYSIREWDGEERIPIGTPLNNIKLIIVNQYNYLLPRGIAGELCIGGMGVARGYLNRAELSAEKFYSHHWVDSNAHATGILYKTGDQARWLDSGNIEFLGRKDFQVKVRGFRIELKEIESQLVKYKLIRETVVIIREDGQKEKYICAYMVWEKDEKGTVDHRLLREYLAEKLPGYMVPSYFVTLDKIPLTPSGKLDRQSLPIPEMPISNRYIPPRDETERKLVQIWANILNIQEKKISVQDNFFQLGGHSLKATLLNASIQKELNVTVPLNVIFKSPQIRELAIFIRDLAEKKSPVVIEAAEKKEFYPVSSMQERLYILQQMDQDGMGYNMPAIWTLEGNIDIARLENTFSQLILYHESLRTSFPMIEGNPVQKIDDNTRFKIQYIEIEQNNQSTKNYDNEKIPELFKNFIRPFDLLLAPLLRVGLLKIHEKKYFLMVDMHHIITDGFSINILIKNFISVYQGAEFSIPRIQYKDFSEWLNHPKQQEKIEQQGQFWINQFPEEIPLLNLPIDFPRPVVQDFKGNCLHFNIKQEHAQSLKTLAQNTNATDFMLLLSIYHIFLSKLSGQKNIVVGIPISGRQHSGVQDTIGMFVNTLALRNYSYEDQSFTHFLQEIKALTLNAFENQDYPFEDLVEQLPIERDTSRNPLFDVLFNFQNLDTSKLESHDLIFVPYKYKTGISKFDLTLIAIDEKDSFSCLFEFSTALFKETTIKRFITCFQQVLSAILSNPDNSLAEIEIITDAEKQKILEEFNTPAIINPEYATLHHFFEEQENLSPDWIALEWDTKQISYRELNRKANQLAHYLIGYGIKPHSIIGIMLERSIEMLIAIFGVLKAGGGYLPLDFNYPEARINYIEKDSGMKYILTQNQLIPRSKNNSKIIDINDNDINSGFTHNLKKTKNLINIAYVIYTSGSTGNPKGVIIDQFSITSIIITLFRTYPFSEKNVYLLKTSFLFDVSVTELFGWYLGGGKLAILENNGEREPGTILNAIARHHITHINFVPSMFKYFANQLNDKNKNKLSRLIYIFLAGEEIDSLSIKKFRQFNPHIALENLYGPTEATIYASQYSLGYWDGSTRIPIGRPLPNVNLYIMNHDSFLQPCGIPGELYIGGIGISSGYLNRVELTVEKFISHYFGSSFGFNPRCLYRSGDQARWLEDGNVEFLGRIDFQVKVRGFRIELNEIETQLLSHEFIKESVVIIREDSQKEKYICAYVVNRKDENAKFDQAIFREYLKGKLPEYMIPSHFVNIKEIPLTPSGKIDRQILPAPEFHINEDYQAPQNDIQKKLVNIWSESLGIEEDKIGIHSNFFVLGGHSLKALQLNTIIQKEMNIKLPLTEILKSPTIHQIARIIEKTKIKKYSPIKSIEKMEYYPLSPSQRRIFIFQMMDQTSIAYNIFQAVELGITINLTQIQNILQILVKRHESFRTSFTLINEKPKQRIYDHTTLKIEYNDLKNKKQKKCEINHCNTIEIFHNHNLPFDISIPPLLRVGVIKTENNRYILMLEMHHIISDGISQEILLRDFMSLCEGKTPEPIRIHYKDFSGWLNLEHQEDSIKKQEQFWLNRFQDGVPVLIMETDKPRPPIQTISGDSINFFIDQEETERLKTIGHKEHTTLFMIMLSAFYILLYKLCNQEDIVIGTAVAGRNNPDLDKIVGFFVNLIPLRNFPTGEKSFTQFLSQVKQQTLEAFENQAYPFDLLVDQLVNHRNLNRHPIFDIGFTFVNFSTQRIEKEYVAEKKIKIISSNKQQENSHLDLSLWGYESENHIDFIFKYCNQLYNNDTILGFADSFKKIVSIICENPGIKIKNIEIFSHNATNGIRQEIQKAQESISIEFDI